MNDLKVALSIAFTAFYGNFYIWFFSLMISTQGKGLSADELKYIGHLSSVAYFAQLLMFC